MFKHFAILIILCAPSWLAAQTISDDKSILTEHLLADKAYNLIPTDLVGLEITDRHQDQKGIVFAYVRQTHNKLPIFNAIASTAILDDRVVSVSSELIGNVQKRISKDLFISAYDVALKQSLTLLGIVENYDPSLNQVTQSESKFTVRNNLLSDYDVVVEKGYYFSDGIIQPVWRIFLYTLDHKHLYELFVHAGSGDVVKKSDLVLNCNFGSNEVHTHSTSSMPLPPHTENVAATQATNSYNVFAWPVESPNHGPRSVVTDPAEQTASPFGWHDINGTAGAEYTVTRGNNVWARDDKDANNSGGVSPNGGAELIFDAPFDIGKSAELQLEAATINLFYWNNLMHDVWYHYGFDEASGNFQENNYGKGGTGSDFVYADAQDGSGTNNANFSPLPEGQNPRMQMFLWTAGGGGETFIVDSPAEIAGGYAAIQAGFGNKPLTKVPVKGKLVLVNDGTVNPTLACAALVNGAQISGNIAVIDRGSCNFDDKVFRAQSAGAIAVVMINNVASSPIVMGGDATNINIPSVMLSLANGNKLKNSMLTKDVLVTMYDSSGGGLFYFDSDFDNGVIAHEYTHGISTRLTGGPSNSSCLTNAEQMGEGWSDFLSLVMTHAPDDKGPDQRGIGTYLRNQSTDGSGIRPYPYSTSFSINPVTYDYIKLTQFTVPHGVGSVWCSMLWDLYWAFIDVYGYDADIYKGTGGNNMVMHLVMDGLKLQPCNPGFINGRDAILKADELLNGGKNKLLIWQVFAKRGLGYSASQGSSGSKSDGTQSFDLPPSFGGYSIVKSGPETAMAGDTIYYEIVVKNIGGDVLKQLEVVDSLSVEGTFLKSDGRCNLTFNGNTFTMSISNLPSRDSVVCGYYVVVDTGLGGKELIKFDFENPDTVWTSKTIKGTGGWIRSGARYAGGKNSYFISNPSGESDRTLSGSFDLTKVAEPHLVFKHAYNTEATWDGAVVEILVSGIWRDLGQQMIQNGYNEYIQNNPASAIANQPAFTGNSINFIQTIIDLGPYAGNIVELRFRFVSDGLQGGEGWYIDDVELWNGYGNLTNIAQVEGDGLKALNDRVFTSILNENVKDTVIVIIVDVNEELVMFPNPAGSETKVRFGSKVERTLQLELMDITGQYIWNGDVKAQTTSIIPLHGLSDGMYVLRITDGDEVKHLKLIKRSR